MVKFGRLAHFGIPIFVGSLACTALWGGTVHASSIYDTSYQTTTDLTVHNAYSSGCNVSNDFNFSVDRLVDSIRNGHVNTTNGVQNELDYISDNFYDNNNAFSLTFRTYSFGIRDAKFALSTTFTGINLSWTSSDVAIYMGAGSREYTYNLTSYGGDCIPWVYVSNTTVATVSAPSDPAPYLNFSLYVDNENLPSGYAGESVINKSFIPIFTDTKPDLTVSGTSTPWQIQIIDKNNFTIDNPLLTCNSLTPLYDIRIEHSSNVIFEQNGVGGQLLYYTFDVLDQYPNDDYDIYLRYNCNADNIMFNQWAHIQFSFDTNGSLNAVAGQVTNIVNCLKDFDWTNPIGSSTTCIQQWFENILFTIQGYAPWQNFGTLGVVSCRQLTTVGTMLNLQNKTVCRQMPESVERVSNWALMAFFAILTYIFIINRSKEVIR